MARATVATHDRRRRATVPLVQITLAKGRTPEQLAALGEAVTAAVHESIGAPTGNVRVVVTECEPDLWFVGGESLTALRASGQR
ncbi:tautomerase family protein [Pseudonocardia sp. KRD-184]|uniref:4-oxalocrotonate tautomerase n=2 Tax=Pseudonocardia TaxID=1847 RepID=A0A6M6JPC2_9PSEU|nr:MULTISPECIES: 2-hydroxymuconate tautomerase [Pseudonocardia]MBW0091317.1 tautomerase family protein [Pseudonocardia oceani]MBW0098389.1 tautomerase family protein [Pseudonocardia oceani]MBW0110888.1 tautomerase family protein [Pseudonocardia oceani]MBW0123661.1 tautomerase family protein [Pseudonocardia oceani]MBW0130778.1 tautomerase family protein [Pseudonocardia oceani]